MKARGELMFQDGLGRPVLANPIPVEIPVIEPGQAVWIRVAVPALHEPGFMVLIVQPVERQLSDDLDPGRASRELRGVQDALGGCRQARCSSVVLWLQHPVTGRTAPIDADPAPDGNIVIDLERREYAVLAGDRLADARRRGVELRLNHWVTCDDPPRRS